MAKKVKDEVGDECLDIREVERLLVESIGDACLRPQGRDHHNNHYSLLSREGATQLPYSMLLQLYISQVRTCFSIFCLTDGE